MTSRRGTDSSSDTPRWCGPSAVGTGWAPPTPIPDEQAVIAEQVLLTAERHAALREAFTHLPPHCQHLLTLLTHDPPVCYAQISATLAIPIGSTGPLRSRCLQQLRSDPAITALINADTASAAGQR